MMAEFTPYYAGNYVQCSIGKRTSIRAQRRRSLCWTAGARNKLFLSSGNLCCLVASFRACDLTRHCAIRSRPQPLTTLASESTVAARVTIVTPDSFHVSVGYLTIKRWGARRYCTYIRRELIWVGLSLMTNIESTHN